MTTSNHDDDLQALWQEPQSIDVEALVKQVANKRKKDFSFFLFDVISNICALGFVYYATINGFFGSHAWIFPTLVVFTLAYLIWTAWWRRGLWKDSGNTATELLHRQRKHALLDIKVARSFSWGIPIFATLGLIVGAVLGINSERPDRLFEGISDVKRYLILATILFFAVAAVYWGIRKERTAKREIERIDSILSEIHIGEN